MLIYKLIEKHQDKEKVFRVVPVLEYIRKRHGFDPFYGCVFLCMTICSCFFGLLNYSGAMLIIMQSVSNRFSYSLDFVY